MHVQGLECFWFTLQLEGKLFAPAAASHIFILCALHVGVVLSWMRVCVVDGGGSGGTGEGGGEAV